MEKTIQVGFLNCRCLVCWKGFQVPVLSDFSYGEHLFFERNRKVYGHYNLLYHEDLLRLLDSLIEKHRPKKEFGKLDTYLKMACLISVENWEPFLKKSKCPRCGLRFNYTSNDVANFRKVEVVNSSNFLKMSKAKKEEFLTQQLSSIL